METILNSVREFHTLSLAVYQKPESFILGSGFLLKYLFCILIKKIFLHKFLKPYLDLMYKYLRLEFR